MSTLAHAGETDRVPVFERLRHVNTRLLDISAAVLLTAVALMTVLVRPTGEGFRPDDLLGALLVLAQTAPVALRRWSPLGVLIAVNTALVAHSALGYEVVQAGTFGSLVALYGATASTDSRASTIAAGVTALAIVGYFGTTRQDYGVENIAVTSATWAMGWFLGTFVKLEGRVRARTRELQTLLEMSQAVTSTLELRALFEIALDKLKDLIPYTGASIGLREGGETRQITSRRPEGIPRDPVKRTPNWESFPIIQELLSGETLNIADVRSDDPRAVQFRATFAEDLASSHMRYFRSIVTVPLMVKSALIGDLSVTHEQPSFFQPEHVELAQSVANNLAIAIENARLFEETARKARELEALYQADEKLFASLNLDDVLQSLADIAVEVLGADQSLVSIEGAAKGTMVPRAWRNISEGTLEVNKDERPGSETAALKPEKLVTAGPDQVTPHPGPVLEKEGFAATVDVPIVLGGRARGAFRLAWTDQHEASESERASAYALAHRAAVAIQNAEVYARAQQAASLEERQRLARELHDSVSQALYGIALGARTARTQLDRDPVKAAEPMDYVLSLAEAGLAEMRALIFELRPESLETEGLVAALEKQLAATRARHGLSVTARLGPEPEVGLDAKEAIYRIAQEALHNVVKHAQATSVVVELKDSGGVLTMTVADNGRGFDAQAEYPGHIGLRSMRERAEKAGGSFTIETRQGNGSKISVRFPSH